MISEPGTIKRFPTALLALVIPVVAGIAAIGTFAFTDDDSRGAGPGDATTIQISGFEFEPSGLSVAPGTIVTVVNLDSAAHTVTSDDKGLFDTGELGRRDEATFTLTEPGAYKYYCAIHDYMRGSLEVKP